MATIVIAKNNTVSDIMLTELGITLLGSDQLNLTDLFDLNDVVECDTLNTNISNGNITINDGTSDLTIADALKHVTFETEYEDEINPGHSILSHSDVVSAGIEDGNTLSWSSSASTWVPIEPSASSGAGPHAITTHTDVSTDTPTLNQILTYVPSASEYRPVSPSSTHNLASHVDVTTDSPSGNQILSWSPSASEWKLGSQKAMAVGSTPPPSGESEVGDSWYDPIEGFPYYWDPDREKWLTAARTVFTLAKNNNADGSWLRPANVGSGTGFYMHRAVTITGMYQQCGAGPTTKAFELRNGADGDSVILSYAFSGSLVYIDSNMNIDLPAGALLKGWVSDVDALVEDTICQIEVAWRYVE